MAGIDSFINQVSDGPVDIGLLRDVILNTIQIKDNLFIRGAPGIGKSEIVRQVVKDVNTQLMAVTPKENMFKDKYGNDCCYELVEIRLALYDPADISGIPSIITDEYGVARTKFTLPAEFPTNPNWKGIIFLDEMDQAQPAVLNACYKMIQDRMINDWHFPEGTTFIAAGNGEFSQGFQNELPDALKNRFTNIKVKSNLDSWISWAIKAKINPLIITFLKSAHPEFFLDLDAMKKGEDAFATPRAWEVVSKIMNSNCRQEIKAIQIKGRVGFTVGTIFLEYCNQAMNIPDFKAILEGKSDISDSNLDIFYHTMIGCLNTILDAKGTNGVEWSENLANSILKLKRRENIVFGAKLMVQTLPFAYTSSDAFIKIMAKVKQFQGNIKNGY